MIEIGKSGLLASLFLVIFNEISPFKKIIKAYNTQKDLNHLFYRERIHYLMAKPSQLRIDIK